MKARAGLRIGLTGGIASGKSTVSEMLRSLGAVVVDTDRVAREVTVPGSMALAEMQRRFGPDILNKDGSLRRDEVGKIVFTDPVEKKWLENLLHPLIKDRAEELAHQALSAGKKVVVFDVPLLFETGWNEEVDEIWTVYVSPDTQQERLRARDGFTQQEAEARIASQWPIGEKAVRSQVVIDNSGTLEYTDQQVKKAWEQVR